MTKLRIGYWWWNFQSQIIHKLSSD